jgi:capsular polysaccharide biosynthesis protein
MMNTQHINSSIIVRNPIIIPAYRARGQKSFKGGILDSSGIEITEARMWRMGSNQNIIDMVSMNAVPTLPKKLRYISGNYIYLGGLYDHYGHFLLESLARVPLDKETRSKTSFIHLNLTNASTLPTYVDYYLKALNISSIPITVPTKINGGSVIVPFPRMIIDSHFNPSQMQIYEDIKEYALRKHEKVKPTRSVYLSRSRLTNDKRKIVNEKIIEDNLAKKGFEIVHMQELSVENQIVLISQAKNIVGFLGSAMHSLIFADKRSKAVVLFDGRIHLIDRLLNNYMMCDKMIGRKTTYIDVNAVKDSMLITNIIKELNHT